MKARQLVSLAATAEHRRCAELGGRWDVPSYLHSGAAGAGDHANVTLRDSFGRELAFYSATKRGVVFTVRRVGK